MTLRLRKLSKLYGQKWALRDVDLDVDGGSVFGIFGGTASGKTTLVRCIAGVEKPNGGSIAVNEKDVTKRSAKDRDVYYPDTVRSGGIGGIFGRNSHSGSAGESRLAELRTSLASDKTLVLLDEPLLGLDDRERDQAARAIREGATGGRSIIVASASFEDIAATCSMAAVINNGEIVQVDTPQNLYSHPVSVGAVVGRNNLFTARRLSSSDAGLPEFMSADGGHRLFAQQTEKNRLGAIDQNVTLAIRPEQVSISFGASFPEDNLLKATVMDITFRGKTTLIELDAAGLKLEARVFRVVGLNAGDECMISLPPDRLQVLKD
jgi:ABC-type Fe3+/spermidine/putrescine transport system ATPase subunit